MAYSATNWTDGTTPVNASNMNKIESGLSDQDTRITTLETASTQSLSVTILDRSGTITVEKIGPVCLCRFALQIGAGSSTSAANTIDVTIPSGYRPANQTYVNASAIRNNAVVGNMAFRVQASGAVTYFTDYSANAVEAYATAVWLIGY